MLKQNYLKQDKLSLISGLLVFLLFGLSMSISYDALRSLAAANGYDGWRSYLMPLIIDLGITVFSFSVLRSELLGERRSAHGGWVLVIVYTAVSVVFNVGHVAEHLWTGWRFVFATAVPLTLFFSFERLMGQLKSMTNRSAIMFSLDELKAEQNKLMETLAELNSEIERKGERIQELKDELSEHESELEIANLNDTQQEIIAYLNSLPNGAESNQEIAKAIRKSKTTVYNYVKQLTELGLVSVNGTIKTVPIGE